MKKKGFTLIELLAVIIVIAVIAIITVPTILGVIDKSRKAAYKDSIYGIIDSARIYLTMNQENIKANEEIEFVCNGISCSRETNGDILSFKGTVPKSGSIYLQTDGSVLVESVYNGKYYANNETGEVVISEDDTTLTRGELTKLVKELREELNQKADKEDVETVSIVARDAQEKANNAANISDLEGVATIANEAKTNITNINTTLNDHSTKITNLETGKAALVHTHDDRYFTESEINSKVTTINTSINDKQKAIKTAVLDVSAVANIQITTIQGMGYYAAINVDYSSLNGKNILNTSIIRIGDDTTQGSNGNLPTNVLLSSIARDGVKINRIGVMSNSYKTIRCSILVLYTD